MKNIGLLLCLILAACSYKEAATSSRRTVESFHVNGTESFFVDGQGPSAEAFNVAVKAALSGDDNKLAYILSLARFTDGEGSLSYGAFLSDVKAFIGSQRFDRALKTLPKEEQFRVTSDMKSADELRRLVEQHKNP